MCYWKWSYRPQRACSTNTTDSSGAILLDRDIKLLLCTFWRKKKSLNFAGERANLACLEVSGTSPAENLTWDLPSPPTCTMAILRCHTAVTQGLCTGASNSPSLHTTAPAVASRPSQAHTPSSAVSGEVIAAANNQGAANLQPQLSAAFSSHLNQFHLRKKKKFVCFS